jgi:hypothetical protein
MAYDYLGVKFRTQMTDATPPDDPRIHALAEWCVAFDQYGLAPPYDGGSYGNLSFRIMPGDSAFIITASSSGLGDSIANDRFVTVDTIDLAGGIVYARGSRLPSSESMVHHAIYRTRPDINAIFHGHCDNISRNATTLSAPITHREAPYGTRELVEQVMRILHRGPFIEMRNHGFLSTGKTIEEAGMRALEYAVRAEGIARERRDHSTV